MRTQILLVVVAMGVVGCGGAETGIEQEVVLSSGEEGGKADEIIKGRKTTMVVRGDVNLPPGEYTVTSDVTLAASNYLKLEGDRYVVAVPKGAKQIVFKIKEPDASIFDGNDRRMLIDLIDNGEPSIVTPIVISGEKKYLFHSTPFTQNHFEEIRLDLENGLVVLERWEDTDKVEDMYEVPALKQAVVVRVFALPLETRKGSYKSELKVSVD